MGHLTVFSEVAHSCLRYVNVAESPHVCLLSTDAVSLSKCQETDLPSLPIKRKNFRFFSGFFNLLLSRYSLKFFRFFLTILVTANESVVI